MDKVTKAVLILCGILFGLLVFTAVHNYNITIQHNKCAKDFNECSLTCPDYNTQTFLDAFGLNISLDLNGGNTHEEEFNS